MKLAYSAFLSAIVISGNSFAADLKVVGTFSHKLKPVQGAHQNLGRSARDTVQEIKLLKIELSDKAKRQLALKANKALSSKTEFAQTSETSIYPPSIELGMNSVPVLDQGKHGTCVTFATTAAIDAALNRGDYVSQVCSLQLGNYLQKNGYYPSGWNGSLSRFVLNQFEFFGIVSKEQQQTKGCGGLTNYPLDSNEEINGSLTVDEHHQMSESLADQVASSPVLDVYTAFDRIDTNKTLNQVKAALNAGDRLTFGVLLLDFDLGFMGAVGKKQVEGDTWVLTPEIARDALHAMFGGHEMVITGYDDNAVAIDSEGKEHKGLLTLRNSWGETVGDRGNFYMSYDYFKLLVIEVDRIRSIADNSED